MGNNGWEITGDGIYSDPIHDADYLHEVYTAADPDYTGRVTVPTLWDKKHETIVNNESREILRMFDVEFTDVGEEGISLYRDDLADDIESTIDAIYEPINNGVYRAGFADTQGAYEEAVTELFDALEHWNEVLSGQRYLCGSMLTEADICMFTTLVRFDPVYAYHFKCNVRRLDEYEHLFGYLRDIYQLSGVKETLNFAQTKEHYYWSHETVNPKRIVPVGPPIRLDGPHGRDHLEQQIG
jgi:putative glutathione S-transferase